jgi:hypothetical protein
LAKRQGEKGVVLPKDDSQEEHVRYGREIGVPDSPDGYDFEGMKAGDREIPADDLLANAMRENFQKRNATPAQARGLVEDFNVVLSKEQERMNAEHTVRQEATTAELKTAWGSKYDEKMSRVNLAAREFFGGVESLDQVFKADGSRFTDDQAFIERLQTLGEKLGEDSMAAGGAVEVAADAASARSEIDSLIGIDGDPEFKKKYFNPGHPGYKDAVQRVTALYAKETPEG